MFEIGKKSQFVLILPAKLPSLLTEKEIEGNADTFFFNFFFCLFCFLFVFFILAMKNVSLSIPNPFKIMKILCI